MSLLSAFFFFNDTATTEIYTLSLHDALPISFVRQPSCAPAAGRVKWSGRCASTRDRKSTRLNSSHSQISYAVFCLKKKQIVQIEERLATRTGSCADSSFSFNVCARRFHTVSR